MGSVLFVGGTGQLGRVAVTQLRETGSQVRALVRPGRDDEVTRALAAMGVELTRGDLKDADSVATACKGVETVVCTASAISSQTAGDSIQSVDAAGNAG